MTNPNVAVSHVPLAGVTQRSDLFLRELWLAYAHTLGPHWYVPPITRPEHYEATLAFRALRGALPPIGGQTELAKALRAWFRAVEHAQGMHGLRPAATTMLHRETSLPLVPCLCEPYLRAAVDDAIIRLEGRDYTELTEHVACEIKELFPHLVGQIRSQLNALLSDTH